MVLRIPPIVHVREPPDFFCRFVLVIDGSGLGACAGMVGFLGSGAFSVGCAPWRSGFSGTWVVSWVRILLMYLKLGLLRMVGMLMSWHWRSMAIRVWADGSAEVQSPADATVAGAGAQLPASALATQVSTVAEDYDAIQDKCRVVVSVPGPLQKVQRAEF